MHNCPPTQTGTEKGRGLRSREETGWRADNPSVPLKYLKSMHALSATACRCLKKPRDAPLDTHKRDCALRPAEQDEAGRFEEETKKKRKEKKN